MTNFSPADVNIIFSKYGNIDDLVNRFRFGEAAINGFSNALDAVLDPLLTFSFSGQNFVVGENASGNPTLNFTLPDQSVLGFILDTDILKKIEASDEDCLFAVDYAPAPSLFSDMFRGTLFESLAPNSAEFVVSTKFVTSLGGADLKSGISLVTEFDLSASTDPFLHFAYEYLHVGALQAIATVNLEQQLLAGNILLHDVGFSVGEFGYSFESLGFEIALEEGNPVFTAGATSLFRGYDPFQKSEPDLLLSGEFSIDPESLTLFGQVDADNWHNPFGFPDLTIRTLGLQLGGTYVTPFLDNLGFIVDMKLGQYDYHMVLALDLTTPDKNAIELTLNEPANVARMLVDIQASSFLGVGAIQLTNLLAPLFTYLPLTVESFDSNGDGELDPIIMAVPFLTEIGGVMYEPGFGINALVRLAGAKGSLALNANEDFEELAGSLEIDQISLGNFLTIGGVVDGDPLTLAFDVGPARAQQSLSGNGKISVFGFDIVQADFAFSITGIQVGHSFIDLGIGRFTIDSLDINPTAITASGRGEITVLDTQLVGAAFTLNSHELSFAGKIGAPGIVEMEADFHWDDVVNELSAAGDVKIGGVIIPSATLLVKADGTTTITGMVDFTLQGLGHFNAELDVAFQNHAYSLSVAVDVQGLGPIRFGLAITDDILGAIEHKIEDLVVGAIGEQVIWVANAIASGVADAFSVGNFNYVGSQIDDFFTNAIDAVGDEVDRLFGHNREKNKTIIDGDNGDRVVGNGGNDAIFGNAGDDTLQGQQGNDALDGGAGNDVISAGSDNDLANGGNGDDYIIGEGGADTLYGGFGDDQIFGDFEGVDKNSEGINQSGYHAGNDVLHGGAGNDSLYGGAQDDILYGDDGSDVLDGGTGADLLYGGRGDDTYDVTGSTLVIEYPDEGIDTIRSVGNYTLQQDFENLYLTPAASFVTTFGTGNNLNNLLVGGSGADDLTGLGGNDTLDGGLGADTLVGGEGNDTYIIDGADTVVEAAGQGIDTVIAGFTYTLGSNLENLTLAANTPLFFHNGTGNALDNVLIGNSKWNNLLGLEGNDTLDGGGGVNQLLGGNGNDTYFVNSDSDLVIEDAGPTSGIDTVNSSISYVLTDNVEFLTLTGAAAINGTGNGLANRITGNAAANILDGAGGSDTLAGLAGNDSYLVDSGDTVIEQADDGIDTVIAGFNTTLGVNLENLILTGSADIDGTGNELDNALTGSSGNNRLEGGKGDDTLDGGAGADTLIGGDGGDTYLIDNIGDVVVETGTRTTETDTVISSISFILGVTIENLILTGAAAINGTGNSLANMLAGNDGANTLAGGKGDDTLDGGAGADVVIGGEGNDTYVAGVGDTLTEAANQGTDTVISDFTFTLGAAFENLVLTGAAAIDGTGNELANAITGNDARNILTGGNGDDTLTGGGGADTLIGGAGNDTYVIDVSDTVVEAAGQGIDTVIAGFTYTLGSNLENLTLAADTSLFFHNGTGNALDNVLTGNSKWNNLLGLEGNDTLDGGAGVNQLLGGNGNDTYFVNSDADLVIEAAGPTSGIDTVNSSISYLVGDNVENLTLTGLAAIDGTGNSLGNVITGNEADNMLDGGQGSDTLLGGYGDDTYIIDNAGDLVTEAAGQGADTVRSGIAAYTLTPNVENLIFDVAGDALGTGNGLANTITGGDGNDVLSGGGGDDLLLGGAANDTLIGGDGLDVIVGGDGIDTAVFAGRRAEYTLTVTNFNTQVTRQGGPTDRVSGVERLAFDDQIVDFHAGSGQTVVAVPPLPGSNAGSMLEGAAGNDSVQGNSGNDTLMGGLGADTLTGGAGLDTFTGSAADLNGDLITDYQAGEIIAVQGESFTVDNVTLTQGSTIIGIDLDDDGIVDIHVTLSLDLPTLLAMGLTLSVVSGPDGTEVSFIPAMAGVTREGSPWGGSTLDGAGGNDLLLGQGWGNTINALAGNDVIQGGQGNAHIDGGDGQDIITAGGWNNWISGGSGNDVIDAGQGNAWVDGGSGHDHIIADGWNNVIFGGSGNDTIDAGQGSATVDAGRGDNVVIVRGWNNTVTAGAGSNMVQGANGNSTFDLGDGNNVIQSWGWNNIVRLGDGNNLIEDFDGQGRITAGDGNNTIGLHGWNNELHLGNGINYVTVAAGGNTVITAGTGANTLHLSGWNNLVSLGGGALDGVDKVWAGMGMSVIRTGSGADQVWVGASGGSQVDTGAGNDVIYTGGAYFDLLRGGQGNDQYVIRNSTDTIIENAGEGYDIAWVEVDGYTMALNVEEGHLSGGARQLMGATGADKLVANATLGSSIDGGAGDDMIWGQGMADVLKGGLGNDVLSGGSGADRFVFDAPGWGTDQISDFTPGQDKLDLRGLGLHDVSELHPILGTQNTELVLGNSSIYLFGVTQLTNNDVVFA